MIAGIASTYHVEFNKSLIYLISPLDRKIQLINILYKLWAIESLKKKKKYLKMVVDQKSTDDFKKEVFRCCDVATFL